MQIGPYTNEAIHLFSMDGLFPGRLLSDKQQGPHDGAALVLPVRPKTPDDPPWLNRAGLSTRLQAGCIFTKTPQSLANIIEGVGIRKPQEAFGLRAEIDSWRCSDADLF